MQHWTGQLEKKMDWVYQLESHQNCDSKRVLTIHALKINLQITNRSNLDENKWTGCVSWNRINDAILDDIHNPGKVNRYSI